MNAKNETRAKILAKFLLDDWRLSPIELWKMLENEGLFTDYYQVRYVLNNVLPKLKDQITGIEQILNKRQEVENSKNYLKDLTKKDVKIILLDYYRQKGRVPRLCDLSPSVVAVIYKLFDSFNNALIEAGLKINKKHNLRWKYSGCDIEVQKKKVLEFLEKYKKKHGVYPTYKQVDQLRKETLDNKIPSSSKMRQLLAGNKDFSDAKKRLRKENFKKEVLEHFKDQKKVFKKDIVEVFGRNKGKQAESVLVEAGIEIVPIKPRDDVLAVARLSFPVIDEEHDIGRIMSIRHYNGASITDIAKEFNISKQRVCQIIKSYTRRVVEEK